ncbi:MAG: radical SAM protein [Christensenellales bacterium]|jgi:MoaA/NifB/PqqE/SkfB family radical SAM enzyme
MPDFKNLKRGFQSAVIREALGYLEKDPIENFPRLLNWGARITKGTQFEKTAKTFCRYFEDPNSSYGRLIRRFLGELNPSVRKNILSNYFINSGINGTPLAEKKSRKLGIRVPWAILMDPTTACNLKCVGCWAGEYEKSNNLSYEKMDQIICEGKALGIYVYLFSGGEPLIRKNDLLRLCEKHSDCVFIAFTNATLISEKFVEDLKRVANFTLAISIEGFEEETDFRRGKGTYKKIMHAMDLLKGCGIPFGYSACYHSQNTSVVGSDEFVDSMIEKGCLYGWLFTYMPLGKNAATELLATDDQRAFMYHRIREMREKKPIFLMDFWNDGEFVGGCIAGGRKFFHINANGDVEPCAFIHYATCNINDVSLIEALKSPLFKQYEKNQPFNDNMLRPCPLLDNPDKLREMVHACGAYSTQPLDKESVDELIKKTEFVSKKWAVTSEKLWKNSQSDQT